LEDPRFRGQISAANGVIEGHAFDRFSADVQASRESIAMQKIALSRGVARVSGDASLAANRGDFSTGALAAQLTIRNLPLADAEKEWNIPAALTGLVNTANVRLSGAPSAPQAEGMVEILKLTGMGQEIDRVRAAFRYSQRFITFTDGQADIGIGRALFSAEFQHPPDDYHDGDLKMDVTAQNVGASRIALLRNAEPRFDARLDGKTSLQARIRSGSWEIQSLDGDLSVRNIFFAKERLGEIALSARSKGEELSLAAKAQLRGTPIEGQGKWRLAGEIPGSAAIRFPRTSLTALRDLASIGSPKEIAPPPFQGFVEGGATVQVALRNPRGFQAQIRIDTVEFDPSPKQALRLGVQPQDIQIRNTRPVLVSLNINEARVQKTELVSRGTNLELEGTVPLSGAGGANFNINGAVNLAVLQLLNPDLLARGAATVNASVRGSLRDPMIRGRMEFRNASLYLSDFPNGVDSASGAIAFDRNRATIERLTAETGGGQIAFRGFIEFGEPLIYRLQSEVRQVRVRYPDDVSFTANADLSLTGTSEASTLSGTVTLNRAALRAGADVSRLLAQAAKPAPAPPSPGDVLRGMRFDVRIESSPTFELETSLTRNVETEVDLRLRGTPLTPALLGTVSVTSGEIQVLGTRYTVNRGDIRFLNPVKIEPTVDLDLETRTRGITVNIKVAGQPDKLNVNYSSDPPLQSREIIALLAVGRDPTASAAGGQVLSNTSAFEATGILSEAVSQQLSSRLQRFFGSSRVKIDPLLTGVENLPAARLTLEQQVSRDVTLTYITNLNRTQEQIVRLQWDFSPEWSAIAVRDSNGLFGIDFQYRKRFK
jgi:translocation and assembly module TamB